MKNNEKILKHILEKLDTIPYIALEEIPELELYMDQLTTFMEEHLKGAKRSPDDKILTKTMINNYSKNRLLPSPYGKKYGKNHLLLLIFIYYYKHLLSFSDIKSILSPLTRESFGQKESPGAGLEDIYAELQNLIKENMPFLKEEIQDKFKKAKKIFQSEKGIKENYDYPVLFTFMSELAFDAYIKKQILEQIIDLLYSENKK